MVSKISCIFDLGGSVMSFDTKVNKQWELHDAMFSVDNMLRRVRMYTQARKYTESRKAIRIMLKYQLLSVMETLKRTL